MCKYRPAGAMRSLPIRALGCIELRRFRSALGLARELPSGERPHQTATLMAQPHVRHVDVDSVVKNHQGVKTQASGKPVPFE
ncbi:hypothetical protein F4554_005613 [Actinopolymorpha rutila]|uniref:Uncharacterized protein n=1 Tax=Actinopolymorpha rutila TaxID=446787 RepID=A0A852ZLH2_9ACTN|nr:hypothetical protein [Actinopolymorpha rutila]